MIGGPEWRLSLLGYRRWATKEGWGAKRLDHTRGTISPRAKTLHTQIRLSYGTQTQHTACSVVTFDHAFDTPSSFAWSTPSKKLYVRTRPNTLLLDRSVMQESRICFQLPAQPATFDALSKYPYDSVTMSGIRYSFGLNSYFFNSC